MSDTPRTDAKAQFFGWNPDEGEEFVTASFCRELERENAALKAALDAQMKYQRELREDRDRLDWMECLNQLPTRQNGKWLGWDGNAYSTIRDTIDEARDHHVVKFAIDAAGKETQP